MSDVKLPKNLADAHKTILHLTQQRDDHYNAFSKQLQVAAECQKREKEVHDQFADLKQRLHDNEVELSRLRGYLERVHEDDIVSDGFVEIEDEQGKRMVPKRSPPRMIVPGNNFEMPSYDNYGREKKRTHWTSY